MRILTIRQPWAWAIIHGGKDVENRVRNVAGAYRGPVAIHVATAMPMSADLRRVEEIGGTWPQVTGFPFGPDHPGGVRDAGHIIGVVDLVDAHRANGDNPGELNLCAPFGLCSPWAERVGHHLVLENPRPLAVPIPYTGALGLRTLDEATAIAIWEAIA